MVTIWWSKRQWLTASVHVLLSMDSICSVQGGSFQTNGDNKKEIKSLNWSTLPHLQSVRITGLLDSRQDL